MRQIQIGVKPNYWLIAAIAALSVSSWAVYSNLFRANQQVSTSSPVMPAPAITVTAVGRVEPEGSVIKLFGTNSQDSRVDEFLAAEGEWVEEGQVIAILQGLERAQASVAEAEQNVVVQRTRLNQVQAGTGSTSDRVAQEAVIARLNAQLETERVERQAAIERAKAELRAAEAEFTRFQSLHATGAASASELDTYRRDFETAQASVVEAIAQLDNAQQTITAQIQEEQAVLAELTDVRPVDISVAQAQLDYAVRQLESAQETLDDFYIRVPVSGQILKINTQVGERVDATEGVVDLGQTDQMYVIAEVYETDVPKVQEGQRATILSENGGLLGDLQGTVDHIGLQIQKTDVLSTDPAADDNARVVEVKIRLDPDDSEKVAGLTYMQVRVQIHVDDQVSRGN